METELEESTQILKFKGIPHVDITDLIPKSELLIVKRQKTSEYKKRRKNTRVNSSNNSSIDEGKTANIELKETLKNEFPQISVTPRDFEEKYLDLMAYMEDLNKFSTALEITDSKTHPTRTRNIGIGKITRLKVSASINRILHRNLRVPTISEIINIATSLNIKEAESLGNDYELTVDIKKNPWSEQNLLKYFADRVKLDTYQLVCGRLRFSCRLVPPSIHSHLLTPGPKCSMNSLMLHKRASESYSKTLTDTSSEIVEDNETIITFGFYHSVRGHKYREFDVLSSQTLADLTDSFRCSSQIVSEEFDLCIRGSCYMLNGVLYPDLRGGACDYSENLLDFYKTSKPGVLKTYQTVTQDTAILANLELKLYQSGYFLHYGECEHRVTITNVRMYDKSRDCPYVKCYPVCTFRPNQVKVDCETCGTNEATKTVFNFILLPNNPSYLCTECYDAFREIRLGSDVYYDKGLTPSIVLEYNQE